MAATPTNFTPALVLSGGGAYAAYEVGVMKALIRGASPATNRQPLDPQILTGTSAGAFNAAALLSVSESSIVDGIASLERTWLERLASRQGAWGNGVFRNRLDPRDWLAPPRSVATPVQDFLHISFGLVERTARVLQPSPESFVRRALEFFDVTTFVCVEPFERVIRATLRPDVIRASHRQLRVAATNWDTGVLRVFANDDMSDARAPLAVLASAAIPGFFPPVAIDRELYVDGGVLMNTPLNPAIKAGADMLHVIYMDPDVKLMMNERLDSTISIFERTLLMARADVIERDLALAATIDRNLDLAAGMKTGSKATKRAMGMRHGRPMRPISVHRYHPTDDLGGLTGVLDVDHDRIESLIRQGWDDAVAHDCVRSGCVTRETNWGQQPA